MSILDEVFNAGMMGEPERLDFIIREHQKLEVRVARLEELLRSKGIITDEEHTRLVRSATRAEVTEGTEATEST
jgi:hypothetical protein